MNLRFRHGTDRNTKAYEMRMGALTVYISYDTIIAFECGLTRLRLNNIWGRTTGRHMKDMGVYDWPVAVGRADFDRQLDEAFVNQVRDDVARSLTREPVTA